MFADLRLQNYLHLCDLSAEETATLGGFAAASAVLFWVLLSSYNPHYVKYCLYNGGR